MSYRSPTKRRRRPAASSSERETMLEIEVRQYKSKYEDCMSMLIAAQSRIEELEAQAASYANPPPWKEDDTCFKCESSFGILCRRHHCRNCGNSVCDSCSNFEIPIPRYQFFTPVRTCEACYLHLTKDIVVTEKFNVDDEDSKQSPMKSPTKKRKATEIAESVGHEKDIVSDEEVSRPRKKKRRSILDHPASTIIDHA